MAVNDIYLKLRVATNALRSHKLGFSSFDFLKLELNFASLSLMINYSSLDLFQSAMEFLNVIYVIIDEFF